MPHHILFKVMALNKHPMRSKLIIPTLLISKICFPQVPEKISKQMGENPIIFIDSTESRFETIQKLNPFDISIVAILVPKKAKKSLGEKGKDGAVYVTTVEYARKNYWKFLTSQSKAYADIVPSPESDSTVAYILNDSLLTNNIGGKLFPINRKNFKRLSVINPDELKAKYNADKKYGIIIKTKKGKKKAKPM
jgi:hypothetical protein